MIIYCIANRINGKVYIGQTVRSLNERWSVHVYHAKTNKDNSILCRAIRKYGKENFDKFILTECKSIKELDLMERFYIKLFDSIKYGYNAKDGGAHGRHSDETKLKMSEIKKNNPPRSFLGKTHSEETKKKISETKKLRKKPISEELRKKRSERMMGNQFMVGRKMLPQVRLALIKANTGRVVSEEVKEKISESNKKTYQLKLLRRKVI